MGQVTGPNRPRAVAKAQVYGQHQLLPLHVGGGRSFVIIRGPLPVTGKDHVAEADGCALGYILAHPWSSGRPPPVDSVLAPLPSTGVARILYVHDLSVAGHAKGGGLGLRLLDAALDAARRNGLRSAELVAVPGASGFWQRMGFRPLPMGPELARKVRHYGDDALYMGRDL